MNYCSSNYNMNTSDIIMLAHWLRLNREDEHVQIVSATVGEDTRVIFYRWDKEYRVVGEPIYILLKQSNPVIGE